MHDKVLLSSIYACKRGTHKCNVKKKKKLKLLKFKNRLHGVKINIQYDFCCKYGLKFPPSNLGLKQNFLEDLNREYQQTFFLNDLQMFNTFVVSNLNFLNESTYVFNTSRLK